VQVLLTCKGFLAPTWGIGVKEKLPEGNFG
jgi:hypothetical protein